MTDNKCCECGEAATQMVWGCCEYYRSPMCESHAALAISEDWGRATVSCEPTDSEPMGEYLVRRYG